MSARRVHVLFGAALALLLAVSAWWLVFLAGHVEREHALRLEVMALERQLDGSARQLDGSARQLDGSAGPSAAEVETESRRLARRRLMVVGEGALLVTLVLTCVVALHALVVVERRRASGLAALVARASDDARGPMREVARALEELREAPPGARPAIAAAGLEWAGVEEHLVEALLAAQALASGSVRPRVGALAPVLERFAAHRSETLGGGAAHVASEADVRALTDEAALHALLEVLADHVGSPVRVGARADGGVTVVEVTSPAGRGDRKVAVVADELARALGGRLSWTAAGCELSLPRA